MAQKARAKSWDQHALKTGHDAMTNVPYELVQILEALSIL
jgi:hypothetical protein